MFKLKNTKYEVKYTLLFKKNYKKILKQGKNEENFLDVLKNIANDEKLEKKYRNHKLIESKHYKNCYECHIENDWLLIYQINENKLILLLITTGSHSELF